MIGNGELFGYCVYVGLSVVLVGLLSVSAGGTMMRVVGCLRGRGRKKGRGREREIVKIYRVNYIFGPYSL